MDYSTVKGEAMRKLNVNGSWMDFRDAIKNDESFVAGGHRKTLRGEFMPATRSIGQLPEPHAARFDRSWFMGGIDWVVYSYDTPIAWRSWGCWIVPDVRYSVTTSKHQGRIRPAISNL